MDRLPGIDVETVEGALDVLQDMVLWELTPQRWELVRGILDRIAVAVAARDAGEVRSAVADLQLSGPVRILRIGSASTASVPEPVIDLQNVLVHALVAERSRQEAPPDGAKGGHGG